MPSVNVKKKLSLKLTMLKRNINKSSSVLLLLKAKFIRC
ncbi:Uncharacterised protein [Vibrio cholerae]|nr:Uncharacterised protein [Vibrio cholerae]